MTADELHRLLIAPELIVLDVVDAALTALGRALIVEHPMLDGGCSCQDPPIRHRARAILRLSCRLSRALNAYRATANEIISKANDDDIPF